MVGMQSANEERTVKSPAKKKLRLSRTTVARLDSSVLRGAAGGVPQTYTLCTGTTVPSVVVCPTQTFSEAPGCTLYPCTSYHCGL
jgi:hypothetical protein